MDVFVCAGQSMLTPPFPLSYILLAPRDKDHYSPILDLERTLYTIIERE
jgi:hypothetical protein